MLFEKEKNIEIRLIPTLYPMGALTFAIACRHCKNKGSSCCFECKQEKKSHFEPRIQTKRVKLRKSKKRCKIHITAKRA